jgi:MFS family permease
MWRKGFRGWFYLSIAAAMVVSFRSGDLFWLVLEIGMVAAVLGRYPLFDQPEEPELQRPLTVFMVIPFTIYVLMSLFDLDSELLARSVGTMAVMMASLLLCLFFILILVKRTEFHMNYRFILGFATVASISMASLFTLFETAASMMMGDAATNDDLMRSLIGIMAGGIVSGLLFKRDMRRMDYTDLLMVEPEESA